MTEVIKEKIDKIEEKKKSLEAQKKLLLEKERQKEARLKAKRQNEIGKLAGKAGIDSLDDEILFGAFLEIKKLSIQEEKIKVWKELAESQGGHRSDNDSPISVSFNGNVGPKERKAMKSLGFRYNKFRNEFYGYGTPEKIKEQLNGFDYKIESLG